jgi:signal transduction histidine kinase
VLNSVNVSAKIIRDRVRDSRQAGVAKLASLITDNASDLPRFFAEDARGKQLPAYIQQLSAALAREREQVEVEIDQLMSGIQHISEVVRMQQNCARSSTVLTEISPVQIMEEALRVNLVAMERHRIEVSKRYADPGPLMLDKHKILPALVNFISNAKQATSGVAITDRRITLHVRMEESNVIFEVEDNGCGIAPEVMPKLFRHGFTTKSDGHGFGLHSAANAAKEMGGGVSVRSDGPGRGAVFAISIPAQRVQRREAA